VQPSEKIDSNEYESRSLLSGAIKRIETLVTEAADAFLRDYPDLLQAQVIARVIGRHRGPRPYGSTHRIWLKPSKTKRRDRWKRCI